jgi:F0F1-type ATP synthase epsilon subunit
MAALEPFFFHTQGHGVAYLATQYATMDEYSGQTYIATGAFENINPKSDGKRVYSMDGRYTDQMNEASIFGRVNVRDTEVYTQAKMKKFIKDQGIKEIKPDQVTLFASGDTYWFVRHGVLDPSLSRASRPKSRSNSVSRSKSKSKTKSKRSANANSNSGSVRSKSKLKRSLSKNRNNKNA